VQMQGKRTQPGSNERIGFERWRKKQVLLLVLQVYIFIKG